jgi:hypothetical protein
MDHQSMISQVKQVQRSDPAAKQQWWDYADTHLAGSRDPARHDVSTLMEFMNAYNSGALPPPSADGSGNSGKGGGKGCGGWSGWGDASGASENMVDFIKTGQKNSRPFKMAWVGYCGMAGNGKFDPSKYNDSFINGFIQYLGNLAAADMGGSMSMNGGGMKRVGDGSGPGAKRQNAGSNELAENVKALQRSSAEAKEAWWSFCDTQHGGVRDPNRHDPASLQSFLSQMGA